MRNSNLRLYLTAKTNSIYVHTYEELAVLQDICEYAAASSTPFDLFVFDSRGLYKIDSTSAKFKQENLIAEVKNIRDFCTFIEEKQNLISRNTLLNKLQPAAEAESNACLFIIKDINIYFNDKHFIRALRDLKESLKTQNFCCIVGISPVLDIPVELNKLFSIVEYPLLTHKEIYELLNFSFNKLGLTEEEKHTICKACAGLTQREIMVACTQSLAKHDKKILQAVDIEDFRMAAIKQTPGLENIKVQHTLNNVAGFENFKKYMQRMRLAYSPAARSFGIKKPKGLVLTGLPGVGKTMFAEVIASELKLPLLALNCQNLLGSLVGQSENNLSAALKVIESQPCVLLLDEFDKALAGHSGSSDGGVAQHIMATLLEWLQKDSNIVAIATSNDLTLRSLPPQLLRAGRFDEIFFFDIPNVNDRKSLLNYYITEQQLEINNDAFSVLLNKTEGYSCAEIKKLCENILLNIFLRSYEASSLVREPTLEDIEAALRSISPVYIYKAQQLEEYRGLALQRYQLANSDIADEDITCGGSHFELPLVKKI